MHFFKWRTYIFQPQNERCLQDKPSVQAQETATLDHADYTRDETKGAKICN